MADFWIWAQESDTSRLPWPRPRFSLRIAAVDSWRPSLSLPPKHVSAAGFADRMSRPSVAFALTLLTGSDVLGFD